MNWFQSRNDDYKNTYTSPEYGNVRYPSSSRSAIKGWAYVFTQDRNYVERLSHNHLVEVKSEGVWCAYAGYLPLEKYSKSPQDEDPTLYYNDEEDGYTSYWKNSDLD